MNTAVNRARVVLASLVFVLCAAAAGCGHDIGDNCLTSTDCDPSGTRSCDLSQPGGYCTIVGCDEVSCPSGSDCIRYFPEQYLSKPCDATCEDLVCDACTDPSAPKDPNLPCNGPDGTSKDQCLSDELCLNSGLCAKRSYEQRACAKTCGSNGDCRGGYECRPAGTQGSMLLAQNPGATASFCAPMAP